MQRIEPQHVPNVVMTHCVVLKALRVGTPLQGYILDGAVVLQVPFSGSLNRPPRSILLHSQKKKGPKKTATALFRVDQ